MKDIDDRILDCIKDKFMTVKELSTELSLPYVRITTRLRQMRKRNSVIFIQSNESNIRGVKPLKYKQKK